MQSGFEVYHKRFLGACAVHVFFMILPFGRRVGGRHVNTLNRLMLEGGKREGKSKRVASTDV